MHSPNTVSPQPRCESARHVLSLVIDIQEQCWKVVWVPVRAWILEASMMPVKAGHGGQGREQEDSSWVKPKSRRVIVHNPARPEPWKAEVRGWNGLLGISQVCGC